MSEDVDEHIFERFELHKRLGKGAYGIVWKAIDRQTKETVALKKIFDGFRNQTDAQRTFREIMFLQEFGRHPNIIKLFNILKADNDSDLKPSNVLLDADCRVKLADFGLARSLSQLEDYPEGQTMPELTEYVATRWYRSPEILLAAKQYTKGVDMWSLGCILGEMILGRALFPGSSTINQIERIMNTIPKPSKSDIESIGSHYAASVLEKIPQRPRRTLESFILNSNPHALDLTQRLLIFAPHKRLNVDQCLMHPYVIQFHSPSDELALNYDITLPLPDHIQLTVDDYRNKIYEIIDEKKAHIQKIEFIKGNISRPSEASSSQMGSRRKFITTKNPEDLKGYQNCVDYPQTSKKLINERVHSEKPQAFQRSRGRSDINCHRVSNGKKEILPETDVKAQSSQNAQISDSSTNIAERKAPIAQAECSDTDYETARSACRPSAEKIKQNGESNICRSCKERAQSADCRQRIAPSDSRSTNNALSDKQRRHSHSRTGIFFSLKKSGSRRHFMVSNAL